MTRSVKMGLVKYTVVWKRSGAAVFNLAVAD
jgi:hypothetical protein